MVSDEKCCGSSQTAPNSPVLSSLEALVPEDSRLARGRRSPTIYNQTRGSRAGVGVAQ